MFKYVRRQGSRFCPRVCEAPIDHTSSIVPPPRGQKRPVSAADAELLCQALLPTLHHIICRTYARPPVRSASFSLASSVDLDLQVIEDCGAQDRITARILVKAAINRGAHFGGR